MNRIMYDYIYVSLRRLSDLAAQLPPQDRAEVEAGFKASIPTVLEAWTQIKTTTTDPKIFDLISMVEETLLNNHQIGRINENNDWFGATLQMYWGPSAWSYHESNVSVVKVRNVPVVETHNIPVVFFGGVRGTEAVLLGGSYKHLRGNSAIEGESTSDLPQILAALAAGESDEGRIELKTIKDEELPAHDALSYCLGEWRGTRQRVTFLAKRLKTLTNVDFQGQSWRVTIGAPLYICTCINRCSHYIT